MRLSVYLTHPVVACWNFTEAHRRRLEARLPDLEVSRTDNEADFLSSLADAEIAAAWKFEDRWFELARKLEWLVTPAAGRDHFAVTSHPGIDIDYGSFHGPLIAETVLGMLLGHCRGLFAAERLRAQQSWPRPELSRLMTTLSGARLGILGFGAIGRWIGRLAKPFGVRIDGVSRRGGEPPEYFDGEDRVLGLASLDDTLARSDFVVLALPATPETDRLLDARRIALLPPHAAVVNVGRGNAIDEPALAAALFTGRLAGAYLDVYAEEPLPNDAPLRRAPNTFLFPHASAIAPQHLDLFIDEFVQRYTARYGRRIDRLR